MVVKLTWAPSKVFRPDFGPKTAKKAEKRDRTSDEIVVSRGGVALGGREGGHEKNVSKNPG